MSETRVDAEEETTVIEGEATEVKTLESEAAVEEQEPEAGNQPAWAKKRFGELTKDKWDARRAAAAATARADEAERQLQLARAARESSTTVEGAENGSFTKEELERLAEEKATAKVEIDRFNTRCNQVFSDGQKTFEDFEAVLSNYRDIGGLTPDFLQAAFETDEPHKILYELGRDRDEAFRVINLPPLKRAVALGKLAVKLSEPKAKAVSKAPPPITGIRKSGTVRTEDDPEKMSTDDWMKWREKQMTNARK